MQMLICLRENFLTAQSMLNVTCLKTYCSNLYCAPMWFDCTKTALIKLKEAYNNSYLGILCCQVFSIVHVVFI